MTRKCPYCQSEVPEHNSVFKMQAIKDWMETKNLDWSIFENDKPAYGNLEDYYWPVGKEFTIGDYSASVVAKKVTYDSGEIDRDGYYDGELPQGSTFNCFVVLNVDGDYFKKTGTGDSYGEVSWDGELRPVTKTVKTVEVFEYND